MVTRLNMVDILGKNIRKEDVFPEDFIKNIFKLLLIGAATGDGSWAQGYGNWAYPQCDVILRYCAANKFDVDNMFCALSAAAKIHNITIGTTSKGNNFKTITRYCNDGASTLRNEKLVDHINFSEDIYAICSEDPDFRESDGATFASICKYILINLYNFFINYSVDDVFYEVEDTVNSQSSDIPRDRYRDNLHGIIKKYRS